MVGRIVDPSSWPAISACSTLSVLEKDLESASSNPAPHNHFLFIGKNEFLRHKAACPQHCGYRLNVGYKPATAVTCQLAFHKSDSGKSVVPHHLGIQPHIFSCVSFEFLVLHSAWSRDGLKYQTTGANRANRFQRNKRMAEVIEHSHKEHRIESRIETRQIIGGNGFKRGGKAQNFACKAGLIDGAHLFAAIDTQNVSGTQFLRFEREESRTASHIQARFSGKIPEQRLDMLPASRGIVCTGTGTVRIRPHIPGNFEIMKPGSQTCDVGPELNQFRTGDCLWRTTSRKWLPTLWKLFLPNMWLSDHGLFVGIRTENSGVRCL